jgi:hypothetical protein
MKKLLFALVLLFSLTSYSQDRLQTINKVNDTLVSDGYIYESETYPKVVILKTDDMKLRLENVEKIDDVPEYYSLYSTDEKFRLDFYDCKVIFYTMNETKTMYLEQYIIELK